MSNFSEQLIPITTDDNAVASLHKLTSDNSVDKNIFLTHGTYSDRRSLMGIAQYLAKEGYTCWLLEWREHGTSPATNTIYNYEWIALYELKAVFEYLFEVEKITHLDTVQHSAGGLLQTMFLVKNPQYIDKIGRSVFFGSQSFGAGYNAWRKSILLLFKGFTKLSGGSHATRTGKAHDESYHLMKQWFDWNIHVHFKGMDGKDYRDEMPKITIPTLFVTAVGDTFVAPIQGCRAFADAFQNSDNQLIRVGKEFGYAEDYNHSRMILSRNAEREIYPNVLKWLNS
ncbi:MAG: alpha/beta hydrolase [Saprospiraceae bacterium]